MSTGFVIAGCVVGKIFDLRVFTLPVYGVTWMTPFSHTGVPMGATAASSAHRGLIVALEEERDEDSTQDNAATAATTNAVRALGRAGCSGREALLSVLAMPVAA